MAEELRCISFGRVSHGRFFVSDFSIGFCHVHLAAAIDGHPNSKIGFRHILDGRVWVPSLAIQCQLIHGVAGRSHGARSGLTGIYATYADALDALDALAAFWCWCMGNQYLEPTGNPTGWVGCTDFGLDYLLTFPDIPTLQHSKRPDPRTKCVLCRSIFRPLSPVY